MLARAPGSDAPTKKHEFARFSRTAVNLRQYRLLPKSHATRSWYRRGYLAILALALVAPAFRPGPCARVLACLTASGWFSAHGKSKGSLNGGHYAPCSEPAPPGRAVLCVMFFSPTERALEL